MKKLVGVVVVLAVLALGVELAAPLLAASRIEQNVRERMDGAAEVSADVGTFPLVTRLVATERLRRLELTLDEVAGQQLTVARVRFDLHGLRLDRDALLRGDVRVTGMRGGTVTAELAADVLSEALGVPVDAIVGEGQSASLPVGTLPVDDELLPCEPQASRDGDRVILTCGLTDVPALLR